MFETRKAFFQDNPAGLLPEQALVLETVNSVEDFYKALEGLHGLEWVGEYDLEDIEPDEDFYDPKNRKAKLPGRFYLLFHNQEGLRRLLSLWKRFQRNPDDPDFPQGRKKFGHLFRQLKTLRPWSHEDRLRETGVLEEWHERIRAGQENMRLEVELWPRRQPGQRRKMERWITGLVQGEHGRVLASRDAVHDYAYHGMLLELPLQSVQRILEDPTVDLARCEEIMFFRPTGQIAALRPKEAPPSRLVPPKVGLPAGEPVAALLDGLPLASHAWLNGRLIVDDPDQWEGEYPVADRNHGTAMASLILHGELDAPEVPLARPLYVRPVMKPHPFFRTKECIPEDVLPVDLIHQAVDRMLNHDGDEPPSAPEVRIVNLSLGDGWRPFDRFPSPWARLLDFLAVRYNVLFIVSAGNHPNEIRLDIPRQELTNLLADPQLLQRESLRAVYRDTRLRRLLSPAEAINALTVGAFNADRSPGFLSRGVDPLDGADLPSLYSAHGSGFRHSVKPEILFPGGRLLFREAHRSTKNAVLEQIDTSREPGQKVATPGTLPSDLSAVRYTRGTSNSTALVTRVACQLYDMLLGLRAEAEDNGPPDENLAVLIKALLVHGASWGSHRIEILKRYLGGTRARGPAARFLGYGCLEKERVLACTDQRVTLLGWGVIDAGRAYAYQLPLPPSLNGNPARRRLVTTLAWFSPINSRHHCYRKANLWLTLYGEKRRPKEPDRANALLGLQRVETAHQETRRGTVQHEVWSGEKATSYEEEAVLTLQVNCAEDAGDFPKPVPYGLAVTLEVAESTGLPIYEEVRTRIRPRIQPPVRP